MILTAVEKITHGAEVIDEWIGALLSYPILLIDIVGAIVIIAGIIRAIKYIFVKGVNEKVELAKSISLGLELVMCGEVLRTVTTRNKEELFILGGIVIIRAILSLLAIVEIKGEEGSKVGLLHFGKKKKEEPKEIEK